MRLAMTETSPPRDANLVEFLSTRARSASDGRLALDAGLGFLVTVVAVIWRLGGWHLIACVGLCFTAFGAWGIADRELRERGGPSVDGVGLHLLRIGRGVAAGVGALAGALLLVSLLGMALGTWVS
jgi:hypothetical protein